MNTDSRVCLVTGAAKGIGHGIVRHLLSLGHSVVAADIDAAAGKRLLQACNAGDHLRFVEADVSSEASVTNAVATTLEAFGRIDSVVNNAALADPYNSPLEDFDFSEWNRVLSVNLSGAFLVSKHTVTSLRDSGGSIVNIASTRALQSEANSEAYAACKGGIVALTHAMAISLGPDIRVNAISPGWIDTTDAKTPGAYAADINKNDHAQHPVGRVGHTQDIAEAVEFLLSAKASFITGQNLVIDGGMTRKMIYAE